MSGQPTATPLLPNQTGSAPQPSSGQPGPIGAGTITDAPKTLTQAEVDAIISRRLAEANASFMRTIREQYGDLDALKAAHDKLKALEDSQKTDLQKAQDALQAERDLRAQEAQKTKDADLKALRLEVGYAKGLDALLSARLQGTTREELDADADAVLAVVHARPRPTPPPLHATAGVTEPAGRAIKLTLGQQSAARAAHMTDEQYIQALRDMEQGQRE